MAGSLGHLAATVSLNIDPFRVSARTLSSTIKSTTAELKAQDAAFKGSEKSISGMKTVYGTLERQAKNYQAQLAREKQTLEERSAAVKKGGADMERLTTREANAAAAVNKTAAQMAILQNRMAALRKEILLENNAWTQASQKAAAFAGVTGKVGSALTSFGSKATMRVTAPIVAGLGAAVKAATDFNSQIESIGPLMTNGAAVTGKYRAQLDQLASSSKKWAVQYGISTTSINAGLADLVRAGYTASQSMKMMPAILDASRASGEDFNGVMEVVTSTMTQFNVKAGNTTRVTDAMTYAANATKSGFGDLGEGLQYTGAAAHAAGLSLNTTISSLALMSNAGLQGTAAGTSFNQMLQKLVKNGKPTIAAMKGLGINIEAFHKGTIGLPEVIDQVTKKTDGMSKSAKVAAINAAFGERGGRAMLALMNAGGKQLTDLTNKTLAASGATEKVSKMMGNTAKANFDKLKSSVQVLGVEVGQNLLPAITPLVGKATEMVQAFGKLDKSTQQNIIKMALFAAAVGPVSSVLGGTFKIMSGGASAFSAVAGSIGRAQTAAKIGANGFKILKSAFSKTAFEALKAAPAAAGAAESIAATGTAAAGASAGGASLLAAIAPLAPVLLGVTAAVGVGYAAWKIWGEKAVEAGERAQRWGTDIGEAADKSATKMKQASGAISGAFNDTNNTVQTNAKTIADGFNSMTKAAKQAASESDKAAKKLAKSLGGDAGAQLLAQAAKERAASDKRIAQMEANAKKAEAITRAANKSGESLTADQIQVLDNLRKDDAAQAVKALKLSGSQQNNVLKAILGEKVRMSQSAAGSQYRASVQAMEQEYEANAKKRKAINDSDKLSTAEKNEALEGLARDHESKLDAIYQGSIQALKSQGVTNSQVQAQLQRDFGMTEEEAKSAMNTYTQAMSKGVKSTSQFAAAVSKGMSASVKKAGNDWNALVLDPKTGKVVTNLPDVLKQTASTKEGWDKLAFELKYAKISSNAKQAIADALAASDQWQKMPSWEKTAIIRTQGKEEVADIMSKFVDWNKLTLVEQQAVVHGDYTALVNALIQSKDWNNLSLKEKEAVVKNKAATPLVDAMVQAGTWNNMTVEEKTAVVNAKGKDQLVDMAIKYGAWNELPEKTKKLLADNSDARQKLIEAGIIVDDYNLNHNPKPKTATANTANAQNNFGLGTAAVEKYKNTNPGPTKVGTGNTSSTTSQFGAGKSAIDKYRYTDPGSAKIARARDEASGPAGKAKNAVQQFASGKSVITKTLSVVANFGKGVAKVLGFKNGTANFTGGLAMVNDAPGSVYREAITLPNGTTFVPQERNAILPLPRHTKIATAMSTVRKFGIPRFANGTTDFNGVVPRIQAMQPQTVQAVNVNAGGAESGLGDALRTLNVLVGELLNYTPSLEGVVRLDNGREVGRWSAQGVSDEIKRIDRNNNRLRGLNT